MRSFCFIISACVLLFGATNTVHAQLLGNMMGGTISIELNPQFPTPQETVQVSLDDYSVNTEGATISWTYDNQAQPQLNNQRSITLVAPPVGNAADVKVTITNQDGRVLESSTTIRPLYLDIIVEPYTFTPPFYKGRSLPIYGSQVQMTALLQDENGPVNAANYTYTWRMNNQTIGGGSSRGKFQNLITIPHGRNQIVNIEVKDSVNRTVAARTVPLSSAEIDIQFYENNPLYGLSQKAITNDYNLISNTTNIYAIPYNLDLNSLRQNLFTEWRIDNQTSSQLDNPFEISLRREGSGTTRISFKLRNTVELLQGAEHNVTLNF